MRAVVRCVLAVMGIAACVVAGPHDIRLAAVHHPSGVAAAAAALPPRGDWVGVARPLWVTSSAPIANRHAAERAIQIKSAPSMTGKFEWLASDVMQWGPARFWAAHRHVAS